MLYAAQTLQRHPTKKPFVVTVPQEAVLQGVYTLQLATCEQVREFLGYSKNSKERVQKLVKQLTDNGYLIADCVPTKKAKSPYYYFLGRKGRQYCEALGLDIRSYFRPSSEKNFGSSFLNHTLSLNDVVISAHRLMHHAPEYTLSGFVHERVTKQAPYKASVVLPDGTAQTVTVIPDAVFDFRQTQDKGKERKSVVLYEHDMGTTEQKHFRRKIRAYLGFLKSGTYKDLWESKNWSLPLARQWATIGKSKCVIGHEKNWQVPVNLNGLRMCFSFLRCLMDFTRWRSGVLRSGIFPLTI